MPIRRRAQQAPIIHHDCTTEEHRDGPALDLPALPGAIITQMQGGAGALWVCEGPCDALALRTAGVPPVVALCGVQGCWGLGGRLVVGEPSRRGAFAAIPAPVRARGARVNHRMSNPSRRSFSGEPVKLT